MHYIPTVNAPRCIYKLLLRVTTRLFTFLSPLFTQEVELVAVSVMGKSQIESRLIK